MAASIETRPCLISHSRNQRIRLSVLPLDSFNGSQNPTGGSVPGILVTSNLSSPTATSSLVARDTATRDPARAPVMGVAVTNFGATRGSARLLLRRLMLIIALLTRAAPPARHM